MGLPLFSLTLSTFYVLLQLSASDGLQLVSNGKPVTSSSTYTDWTANRIVDGDARRSAGICDCCAATDYEPNPWYQLDLGLSYMVHSIYVLGLDDSRGLSLSNMDIKLGNNSSVGEVLTTNTADFFTFNYSLPTPTSGRYLTLTLRNRTDLFVICELYVYAECDTNTYGDGCTQPCGNCLNNETCDSDDGKCTSCAAGYQGDTCKQECKDGKYGIHCSKTCGHCQDGECDHVDGICQSGCEPGYQGPLCVEECKDGKYGIHCSKTCGHCQDGDCDHVDGNCLFGCEPGYQDPLCVDECVNGMYGDSCTSDCGHCQNGEPCNKVNGTCQACECGYTGYDCKTPIDKNTETQYHGAFLGLVIGGPIIGLLAVEALMVLVWFLIKKRKATRKQETMSSDEGHYEMPNRGNFEAEHLYGQRVSAPVYMNSELEARQ